MQDPHGSSQIIRASGSASRGVEWDYENEWRYIKLPSAGSFLEFDESFVSGIILGANASKETKLEVERC
jgi:hypothetical protein